MVCSKVCFPIINRWHPSLADEAALQALLPQGPITDITQLPSSLPSYLISVIPELKLNGTVIKSGPPMRLGNELDLVTQVTTPLQTMAPYTYKVIAGSYLALAAISESVGPQQLSDLQTQLTTTQTALQTQDPTQLASLTREDILGDMFHAGVLGYFAEYNALGHIMALQQRAGHTLAMGYGSYGYEPNVSYFFGIPRAIQPGGVVMNVRLGNYVTSHTNDPQARIQLNQQLGMLSSALEHAIPEQMFTSPQNPGEAISAVKAIAKAQQAGQRIYHITQQNMATALPNIHHDANTMQEIRDALASGKEVTTHADAVSVPGWSGAGYIITDPETGVGAYKIGGGMNGGILIVTIAFLFAILLPLIATSLGGILLLGTLSLLNVLSLSSVITNTLANEQLTDAQRDGVIMFTAALSIVASYVAGAQLAFAGTAADVNLLTVAALGLIDLFNTFVSTVFYLLERLFNSL